MRIARNYPKERQRSLPVEARREFGTALPHNRVDLVERLQSESE